MADALELWKHPRSDEINMIVGWRQWADAGSVSSGLPAFLVRQLGAEPIGQIRGDGFYLFQTPGAHDLMRPVVRYVSGYPKSLEGQSNDFYYAGDEKKGLVIFIGDEPNMDVERYIAAILDAARTLKVRRIIGLGGVFGELPYDKERSISANYSLPGLKEIVQRIAVNLSDYHGGATIGAVMCKRAGEAGLEFIGLYAFVPVYDLTPLTETSSMIRLDNDFTAWVGVMKRINYLLGMNVDISHLEAKSQELTALVEKRIDEIHQEAPQLGIKDYFARLSEDFQELEFNPLDDVWEEELKRLLNKFDDNPPAGESEDQS